MGNHIGTRMLRIRRFGKNRCVYNARATVDDSQNIGHVIAARATPQPVLAKVCICRLGKRGIARVILKGADGGDPF